MEQSGENNCKDVARTVDQMGIGHYHTLVRPYGFVPDNGESSVNGTSSVLGSPYTVAELEKTSWDQ
jgi:hypothetical protein